MNAGVALLDLAVVNLGVNAMVGAAAVLRDAAGCIGSDHRSTQKVSGDLFSVGVASGSREKEGPKAVGTSFSCRLRQFKNWCQGLRAWTRTILTSLWAAWCLCLSLSLGCPSGSQGLCCRRQPWVRGQESEEGQRKTDETRMYLKHEKSKESKAVHSSDDFQVV